MKKSNKATTRKIVIITLMLLVVCLYFVAGTYAKYTWKGTATGNVAVAKWQVGLGKEQTATTNVTFNVKDNANVATGKIAPGCTATGTIDINPEGSEVSVDYKFKIDDTKLPQGIDMKVSSVKVGNTTITRGADGYYSGTIELAGKEALTVEDSKTVTIEATWTDDGTTLGSVNEDGYGSNSDTQEGIKADSEREITIPVTVLMEQHV